MEDEQRPSLSGHLVVTEADLRDDTFIKLVADFLGPQIGEGIGLEDQPCKRRLLVQIGLMREDNQLGWGSVVEWLQKIFPMHQSADFRCLIERDIATTLSLGGDARANFLESNVNFEFVGPICDSIGVERADLLEIQDFSERAGSVEVTNGLILELSNFITREKIDPTILVSWLRNFIPEYCINGNIRKASRLLQVQVKRSKFQYRSYQTGRNRRNAMLENFLQSPFELPEDDFTEERPKIGVKRRMKKHQEPGVKVIIKEEHEEMDVKPLIKVIKQERCPSSDEDPHVGIQNSTDQVENPDENQGEALTLLDIAMLSVQKLTSVYGGKTDASQQVSLDLLKNQYNLTLKENPAMRQFEAKIIDLDGNHSLVSPLHFLHYNAHFLVDINDAIEQELMSLERSIIKSTGEKLGRDKNSKFKRFLNFSESATSRYIHMACDVLSPRAPAKQNYRRHWIAFCEEKKNPSRLAVNRSNRFNNYFEAAAGLIHHHGEIALFFSDLLLLDDDDCPNIILESVTDDANEGVIQALVCVLAIIYCKVLGPYWQLLKSKGEYSLFSQYILCLYQKLLEWSKDASPLLEPETIANVFLQFPLQEKTFNGVFAFCGPNSESPHIDLIRSCLQKMVRVIASVTEANLKDFLPGGEHCQIPTHELSTKLSTCNFLTLMGEYPFGHGYPYKKNRPDKITNLASSSCFEDEDVNITSEDDSPRRRGDGPTVVPRQVPIKVTTQVPTKVSTPVPTKVSNLSTPVPTRVSTKMRRPGKEFRVKRSYGDSILADSPRPPPGSKKSISLAVEKLGGPCRTKQDVDRLMVKMAGVRLYQRREAMRFQISYQKVVASSKNPILNRISSSLADMVERLKSVLPDDWDEPDEEAGQETDERHVNEPSATVAEHTDHDDSIDLNRSIVSFQDYRERFVFPETDI